MVLTIIGGSHLAGESRNVRDKYSKDAKTLPSTQVYRFEERPTKHTRRELEDIVCKADARWVHHLHADAPVITPRVANSNVHLLIVDDGSTVDILYLDTYKRIGLAENALSLATSPLYVFTRDHAIPKAQLS